MKLDFIKWLRHSSPYINFHRGSTAVVMLPGIAIQNENFQNIVYDLALLRSLQIKVIVVFGALPQIQTRLGLSSATTFIDNKTMVTSAKDMATVVQTVGEVRIKIESLLSIGLPNSPMFGAKVRVVSGNFITSRPFGVINGIDHKFTGTVRKIDVEGIKLALDSNSLVVLPPLGISLTGEVFHVKYNDIAVRVAKDLAVDRLVAYTSDEGFRDLDDELHPEMSVLECKKQLDILEKNNITSQSLEACYKVCSNGLSRAHMVSYKQDGAILQELFTRQGSGTLVHSDNYKNIRTASLDDINGIISLIRPLEEKGLLVKRSREILEREVKNFYVVDFDGVIIACAALYVYSEGKAEIACLATHADHQGGGRAAQLIKKISVDAKSRGVKEVFVLTTQAGHWFVENGFCDSDLSWLPEEKKKLYNFQRNSKVYTREL